MRTIVARRSLCFTFLLLSTFVVYVAVPVSADTDLKVYGALLILGTLLFGVLAASAVGNDFCSRDNNRDNHIASIALSSSDRKVISVPLPLQQQEQPQQEEEQEQEQQEQQEPPRQQQQQQQQIQELLDRRTHYLDNIKVALTFLVVLGHCSESAGGIDDVFSPTLASGYEHPPSLYFCCLVISIPIFPVAMNLFFFISGLFVPGSLERKKKRRWVFIKDKLQRYMLPTLLSWLIIMPLSVYLTALATGKEFRYSDFAGGLGPAWFLLWLSLFNLAYAIVQQVDSPHDDDDDDDGDSDHEEIVRPEESLHATIRMSASSSATLLATNASGTRRKSISSSIPSSSQQHYQHDDSIGAGTAADNVELKNADTTVHHQQYQPHSSSSSEIPITTTTTTTTTAVEHQQKTTEERSLSHSSSSSWRQSLFTFDSTLNLWILGIGCIEALVVFASGGYKGIQMLDRSPLPGDFFPYWVPYFFGGCFASSHQWMDAFKNNRHDGPSTIRDEPASSHSNGTATRAAVASAAAQRSFIRCAYWTAPIFVLCLLALTVYLVLVLGHNPFENGDDGVVLTDLIVLECLNAVVGLGMILVILDAASRHFNMVFNKYILFMMPAAYTVYLIQAPVIAAVTWLWIFILRDGMGIDVIFEPGTSISHTKLTEGQIWLGWLFICTLVQLIIWPLAFFIRLLPGLNQIL